MERLYTLRKLNKKTQQDVAKALNISYQAYAGYEKGRRKPDPETLKKLADYFNVSVDYLLGRLEFPVIRLSSSDTDWTAWHFGKIQNSIVSLAHMADFLIKAKKTAIADTGISKIENYLENALYALTSLLAHTSGRNNLYDPYDHELILKKGYNGYLELMNKYQMEHKDVLKLHARAGAKPNKT